MLIAWVRLVHGAAHLVFAWHTRTRRGVTWQLLSAVVYLATGFYLFVEGVLEFILSFQLRPWPGAGWLLVDGIVTFILAAMIWSTWP